VSVFEKVSIIQLLTEANYKTERHHTPNQLILWDL